MLPVAVKDCYSFFIKQGGFHMKKLLFFAGILCIFQMVQPNGTYLWEYNGAGQRSCCLHIGNEDICNPHVACTRNMSTDLFGIYEYIGRVLQMEKISTFPYAKFLNDAQTYIRRMVGGIGLSYRWDEHRLKVKFFHDMVLEQSAAKNDKNKSSAAAATTTDAEKTKQKQEEVFEYLVKIGLAARFKK